ncbi:MAG: hypothetical protein OXU70_19405 [Gammaproteobacteria bacterium]|nr:hypothetical protein [Gammaproteobacteria bacterium]
MGHDFLPRPTEAALLRPAIEIREITDKPIILAVSNSHYGLQPILRKRFPADLAQVWREKE